VSTRASTSISMSMSRSDIGYVSLCSRVRSTLSSRVSALTVTLDLQGVLAQAHRQQNNGGLYEALSGIEYTKHIFSHSIFDGTPGSAVGLPL
jgi:hypothetical protein